MLKPEWAVKIYILKGSKVKVLREEGLFSFNVPGIRGAVTTFLNQSSL